MIRRGLRFRLAPTPDQAARLEQFAGVCRLIYNTALWQRQNQWRQFLANTGRPISFFTQSRELTELREQVPWIRDANRTSQEQALRDLDRAFVRFFTGVGSYPTPRRKGVHDTMRFKGADISVRKLSDKWSAAYVPKIGWVKFRDTRPITGRIVNATISLYSGHWFISFSCEIEHVAPLVNALPSVGIDRGVVNTLTLSTGDRQSVPLKLKDVERRKRRAQRALSRKVRGSARYAKQRRRVAALSARCARIRRDWQHRVTTDIARRFGTVVIENLKITNMTASGRGKRGLNRSILNQGWGRIEAMLAYKLEERGGQLVKVKSAYTSQQCSECGAIDPESRKSQAVFICNHCGHSAHADVNAANNILRGSTPSVEALSFRANEARTLTGC